MRNVFFASLLIYFSACSSSGEHRYSASNSDSLIHSSVPLISSIDTIPHPGKEMTDLLKAAKKAGFVPADTAHVFHCSDHKDYFGLADICSTFHQYELNAMRAAHNTCIELVKKNKKDAFPVFVEEWDFTEEPEAQNIENALSAPLADKRQERFVRTPFTFFRVHERIYYLHTAQEPARKDMDKVNDVLVKVLSPAE
jgi:hypothetical protein